MAEDVASALGGAELVTGTDCGADRIPHQTLCITRVSKYNRSSNATRLWSWLKYFFRAALHVFWDSKKPLLFIVSNPPFLPVLGWMAAILRGQRYCVLVYDLYPGILISLGRLSNNGLVAFFWRTFNRLVWSKASLVYTIGDDIAANIKKEANGIVGLQIKVIPNWADTNVIKPLPKIQNDFLKSLGWNDGRVVILYSGNLGNSHNINALLDAAHSLRERSDIGILIIGSGTRWKSLQEDVKNRSLLNVKLLPFQPEDLLPQTFPSGDIAVVAMESATAGYMVPSKTYNYLAAGAALLALVPAKSEIGELVEQTGCGIRVDPEASCEVLAAIERFLRDPTFLQQCKVRARKLAVSTYGRSNTNQYIQSIKEILDQKS